MSLQTTWKQFSIERSQNKSGSKASDNITYNRVLDKTKDATAKVDVYMNMVTKWYPFKAWT